MKKTIVVMVSLLLIMGNIFAAGANEAASADSNTPKPVTLYLWDSTAKIAQNNNVEAEFEAAYPQYDLIIEPYTFADLESKALLKHSTGDDCDVIQINNYSVAPFVEAGILMPLDDWIKDVGLDLSTYAPALSNVGIVDGVRYATAFDADCRILAFNKVILAECGMTEADLATTDGVMEFARKANEKGYYAMAGQVSKNVFCIYDLGGFMLCWGTRMYEEVDGKYVSQLTKPEVADYMEWAVEMYKYMPKDTNIDDTMARSMFAQGKVAMLWWTPSQVNSVLPKFANPDDVGFLPMPTGPTGVRASAAGGYLIGVGSNTKNKEGSLAFMEWLNKPENLYKLCRGLPADTNGFKYGGYDSYKYDMFKEQLATANFPVPLITIYTEVAEA